MKSSAAQIVTEVLSVEKRKSFESIVCDECRNYFVNKCSLLARRRRLIALLLLSIFVRYLQFDVSKCELIGVIVIDANFLTVLIVYFANK
jgi:hypothetical protein